MLSITRLKIENNFNNEINLLQSIPKNYSKSYNILITIFNQDENIFEQFLSHTNTYKRQLNQYFIDEYKNYYFADDDITHQIQIIKSKTIFGSNCLKKAYIFSFEQIPKIYNLIYQRLEYALFE